MITRTSKLVNTISALVLIGSLFYLMYLIQSLDLSQSIIEAIGNNIKVIIISTMLWSISVISNSIGWKLILDILTQKANQWEFTYYVYSKSNLAKYMPGNFAHLISRNFMGISLRLSQAILAVSSVIELIFLVFSSVLLIIILVRSKLAISLSTIGSTRSIWLIVVLTGLSGAIIFFKRTAICDYINNNFLPITWIKVHRSLSSIISYILSFFIMGTSFYYLSEGLAHAPIKLPYLTVIGIFSLAWLVGFLTPGVPGGIGVREFVVVTTLSEYINSSHLITILVIHRLVSILGDITAFTVGLILMTIRKKD